MKNERRDNLEKLVHPSHDMDEWYSTNVTISSTSRFGEIRVCKKCEAEQAITVAGTGTHPELKEKCYG